MADRRQHVELLYWSQCPSWQRAQKQLLEAMTEVGLSPDHLERREITTIEAAQKERFYGSPTVRVDGKDIQSPVPGSQIGLSCRIYRHRDGRISPLPDPQDIHKALLTSFQSK